MAILSTNQARGCRRGLLAALLLSACAPAAGPPKGATEPAAPTALAPHPLMRSLDFSLPPAPAATPASLSVGLEGGLLTVSRAPGPGEDLDEDGLEDAWEDAVLERLTPEVMLAPDEPFLDEGRPIVAIGRVTPLGTPWPVRVYIALAYTEDYGSCGLSAHHGDSERVALSLDEVNGLPRVTALYTAAHEGTITDRGQRIAGGEVELSGARWRVFSSTNKHASYPSQAACDEAFSLPCFRERCEPGVGLLPLVINAGEPGAPLVDALDAFGFPGERAWGPERFCGGTREGGCSAPLVDKLTQDPF